MLLKADIFDLVSIDGMYTKYFQYHLKYFYHSLDIFFNCWSDLHVTGFVYFSHLS